MSLVSFEKNKAAVLDRSNKPLAMGGWLGMSHEEKNCVAFLKLVFDEMGVDTGDDFSFWRDARQFKRVKDPQFGDIAVFHELPFDTWHVAMMLDERRAIQSASITNGVGKINVTRHPWEGALKGFYRHKGLNASCF